MNVTFLSIVSLMLLAYAQNITFTLVSRSRNRNNLKYHAIASVLSNAVWFMTFKKLVVSDMSWLYFAPYTIATVLGSLTGVKVSMWIEKRLGALSDDHITK